MRCWRAVHAQARLVLESDAAAFLKQIVVDLLDVGFHLVIATAQLFTAGAWQADKTAETTVQWVGTG